MEINAWAAMEKNSKLEPFTYETQSLQNYETLISIDHCGVCYSDLHIIDDDWRQSIYPVVPGHEVVGKIQEIDPNMTHLKKGDLVGISWQRSSCLQCKDCLKGNENLCSVDYQGTIIGHHGGFATHMIADSRFCYKIPKELDPKKATTLMCAGATVYSALISAGMKSGQEVGIIGLGGLGHLAVQFANKLGNKVTVFEKFEDKTEYAYKIGADNVVITDQGVPRDLPNKYNILLNTVDKPINWKEYLVIMDSDSTLCFVGGIGNKIELNLGYLIGQRRRIMGSPTAGRSTINKTLEIAAKYGIDPLIEEFKLEDVNLAIEKTRQNKMKYKGVLNIEH